MDPISIGLGNGGPRDMELRRCKMSSTAGKQLDVDILHKQSNYEGELIDFMHEHMDADGVLVNPAGLTLYGRPLLDAVAAFKKPIAVVHIAQLYKSGDIYGPDTQDYWKVICDVYVCGLRIHGYNAALLRLTELITGKTGMFMIMPTFAAKR
jgi:3-dehydroquinate dehydratase II